MKKEIRSELRELLRQDVRKSYSSNENHTIFLILEEIFDRRGYEYVGYWLWKDPKEERQLDVYFMPEGIHVRVHDLQRNQVYYAPKDGFAFTVNSFLKQLDLCILAAENQNSHGYNRT